MAGDLRRQAMAYAGRGWQVFPVWEPAGPGRCGCGQADCGNVAKHPVGQLAPHGFHDATTATTSVEAWWTARPQANIGIRTGAGSGLVVLDVDGPVGASAVRDLVGRYGRFDALWARTGSGGWHAYLAHPGEEVPNSAKLVGPGLDIRGDGGYVVAPPSVHASMQPYRWLRHEAEVPPMPGWLLEAARPPAVPAAPAQPIRLRQERVSAYVAAAVEGEAEEVARTPAGQRNDRLNLAAFRVGRMVGADLVTEGTATAILEAAAEAAGLTRREAQLTIRSGLSAGRRHPRQVDLADGQPGSAHADRQPDGRTAQEAESC
jgi:hypothetical protein